jgi:hypothetical protein
MGRWGNGGMALPYVKPMGRLLARCLALIIWALTPPATWIAEWLERRRKRH